MAHHNNRMDTADDVVPTGDGPGQLEEAAKPERGRGDAMAGERAMRRGGLALVLPAPAPSVSSILKGARFVIPST